MDEEKQAVQEIAPAAERPKETRRWFRRGMVGLSCVLVVLCCLCAFLTAAYLQWFDGETADNYEETQRFQQRMRLRVERAAPALKAYLEEMRYGELSAKEDMMTIYEYEPAVDGISKKVYGTQTYTFEDGADILDIPTDTIWDEYYDGYYKSSEGKFTFSWERDTYFTRQWEAIYGTHTKHDGIQQYVEVKADTMQAWMAEKGIKKENSGVYMLPCTYYGGGTLCYDEEQNLWYYMQAEQQIEQFTMPSVVYFPLKFARENTEIESADVFSDVNLYISSNNGYRRLYRADTGRNISVEELLETVPFFSLNSILYEAGKCYYTQRGLLRYIEQRTGYLWEFQFTPDDGYGTIQTERSLPEDERWDWKYQVVYGEEKEGDIALALAGIGAASGYKMAEAKFALPKYSMQTIWFRAQDVGVREMLRDTLEQIAFSYGGKAGFLCVISALLWLYVMLRLLFMEIKQEQSVLVSSFDMLPTEVFVGVLLAVAGGCALCLEILFRSGMPVLFQYLFLGILFITAYISACTCFSSLLHRLRFHLFWKRSVLVCGMAWGIRYLARCMKKWRVWFKKQQNTWRKYWEEWMVQSDAKRRTILLLCSYLLLSVVTGGGAVFCFLLSGFGYREWFLSFLLLLVFFVFLQSGAVRYVLRNEIGKERIYLELEQLAEGNISSEIKEEGLSDIYLLMAKTLPRVQDGLQKAMEKSIRDERMKTELITNVTHDIKTPLTSIMNYIDLLKRANPTGERVDYYLDVLTKKSERLKHLIDDLIEASKASSGAITLEKTKLDLTELMEQAAGEFDEKLKEHQLELLLHLPKFPVLVIADGRRMYRILENLLQNVYKYAMAGTRVYFDLDVITKEQEEKAKTAVLTLRNISAAKLPVSGEELMERFVRGEESRTTEGSGLGLSIAGDLTRLQGGSFSIQIDGDLFKVMLEFPVLGMEIS